MAIGLQPETRTELARTTPHVETESEFGSTCAIMSKCVDDCQLDGHHALRNVLWASLRLPFESDDPVET